MRKNHNPFLDRGFKHVGYEGNSMTISGTVIKTLFLLVLVGVAFLFSWTTSNIGSNYYKILTVSMVLAFITSLVTIFLPKISPLTAPLYALTEGIILGYISKLIDATYPGISVPAILFTVALVIATLLIYQRTPIIAGKISRVLMIMTLGISLTYFIAFIIGFFGIKISIFSSSPIGIAFNLIVIIIATLNLIVDYDYILRSISNGAPKYMEWYSAYGLMVTLIWLYTEVLRILIKIKNNDD